MQHGISDSRVLRQVLTFIAAESCVKEYEVKAGHIGLGRVGRAP